MGVTSERDAPPVIASDEITDETTVTDWYAGTIPSAVRDRLDIGPGDKVRFETTEGGALAVEVVRQRTGVFEAFEPVDVGETPAVEDHDALIVEDREPR